MYGTKQYIHFKILNFAILAMGDIRNGLWFNFNVKGLSQSRTFIIIYDQ